MTCHQNCVASRELGGTEAESTCSETQLSLESQSLVHLLFFQYGDYDPSVHKRGFLAQEELLPKRVRR